MNTAIDPVLTMLASAFFALLFGTAAAHKALSWSLFHQQVADYRVLPAGAITPAAVLLPLAEALLALGWLDAGSRAAAAWLSAAMLALYGAAMAWNLSRGRDLIDCGCGGVDGSQVIRPALVTRNLLLAVLAVALAGQPDPGAARALGWIDWLSVSAGALMLMGLYIGANQMLANLPPQRRLD